MPATILGYPFQTGDPLPAETVNLIIEMLLLGRLADDPGVPFTRTSGGIVLDGLGGDGGPGLRWATTPPEGILHGQVGTVTYRLGGAEVDAINDWVGDDAPGSRRCIVGMVDGRLTVILWGCA